jgi:ribosomal protein S27AE
MSQHLKLKCPRCGAEMNHHAMKVEYGIDDSENPDPVFGGVLKEAHYCPHCGHIEFKAAD